jgi:antibiotic biosynthesis monooxygenase
MTLRKILRNRIVREVVLASALALLMLSPGAMLPFNSGSGVIFAQSPQQGFPDLVAALKNTPGCLGVESARTASGKQVLFAWFENKQAVLTWFYSDVHQQLMRTLTPGASTGRKPLSEIADDSGPILAIASLTMTEKPGIDGIRLPVSQIAIELYAPLPGGLASGGRFAPNSVKVPGLLQ